MLEHRKGKVINISSVWSIKGAGNNVPYCTSKGGVTLFTRALALEWARCHINVNALAPGYVLTEMAERVYPDKRRREAVARSVPLGHACDPRDVGLLAVYLASEASDYMMGQTVYIDGGLSI